MRRAQPFVDLLQFAGAGVQLGLQHRARLSPPGPPRARMSSVTSSTRCTISTTFPSGPSDGCVDRAPVVLLPEAGALRVLDVVAEQRHRVALAGGHRAQHRLPGLPHAGRGRVVGVLGEDVEDVAAQQLLAGAPGQPQEVLVGVGVHEVGREQRHHAGQCPEDRRIVDMRFPHVQPALAPSVGVPFHDRGERAATTGRSAASVRTFSPPATSDVPRPHVPRPHRPHRPHRAQAAVRPLTGRAHRAGGEDRESETARPERVRDRSSPAAPWARRRNAVRRTGVASPGALGPTGVRRCPDPGSGCRTGRTGSSTR